MSEDYTEYYYHQPFHGGSRRNTTATFHGDDSSNYFSSADHNPQMFDPSSYQINFPGFFNGSDSAYHNSFSGAFAASSEALLLPAVAEDGRTAAAGGGDQTPATPNSSISSSSTEAAAAATTAGEVKETLEDAEDATSKKDGGKEEKKKKKQREERFAFMTKSEVDHLEDGYRWRKYGQKAVKNSSFPRSYYRCTTQKCGVKKHVERSFQDPSIVITTYVGQHNHHLPVTLRGNISSAGIFSPPAEAAGPIGNYNTLIPNNQRQLLDHHHQIYCYGSSNDVTHHHHHHHHHHHQQQQQTFVSTQIQQFQQFGDYGALLQDIIPPPAFPKHEP
ncbi:hypothetical protein ACP275_13G179100 [Erythranthe tilingii]